MAYKDPLKVKEYNKAYYIKNKERLSADAKRRRRDNPEYNTNYMKQYHKDHKDQEKEWRKNYYKKNGDKVRECSRKRKKSNKNRVKKYRARYRDKNKDKENKKRNTWRATHKLHARDTVLKYHYGISLNEFNALLRKQKNRCGICKKIFTNTYPHKASVDHVHDKTKRVRGLLCNKCNSATGLFGDSPKIIKNALKWLQ